MIAAVHDQVFSTEHLPQRIQLQAGGEDVDQVNVVLDEELQQADPRFVVVHVVRLGIEGELVHIFDRAEKRVE